LNIAEEKKNNEDLEIREDPMDNDEQKNNNEVIDINNDMVGKVKEKEAINNKFIINEDKEEENIIIEEN